MIKDLQVAAFIQSNALGWRLQKIKLLMYLIDRQGIMLNWLPVTDRCRWFKRTYNFTDTQLKEAKYTGGVGFNSRWIIMNCMHNYWNMTATELKALIYDLPEWRQAYFDGREYVTLTNILAHTVKPTDIEYFIGTGEIPGLAKMPSATRKLAVASYCGADIESDIKAALAMDKLLGRPV